MGYVSRGGVNIYPGFDEGMSEPGMCGTCELECDLMGTCGWGLSV